MKKLIFTLLVALTVITACEDNDTPANNGKRLPIPFLKSSYRRTAPMRQEYLR